MAQKKGYDVLRFIEHGNTSYISSAYIEGVLLIQWLSERPEVKKSDCFTLFHEMTKQLELLHKSKGTPVYKYMNPYCIVLSEDGKPALIDMQTEGSTERLRKMQSRKIRERFLPKEDPFYQNSTIQTDLYGLGKTIQFFLSAVSLTTPLNSKEEKQLKKVIARCLQDQPKKAYLSAEEVRKHLPVCREETESKKKSWKKLLLCLLAGSLLMTAGVLFLNKDILPFFSKTEMMEKENIETDTVPADESSVTVENKEEEVSKVVDEVPEVENENISREEESEESEESKDDLLMNNMSKAQSLETLGRYQEAADLYQDILIDLSSISEKERLYGKAADLYLEIGDYDKAYEIIEFGLSELSVSEYLWKAYLDLLTNNSMIDVEKKMEKVEEFLKEHEEYREENCQKLTEEAGYIKKTP